MEQYHPSYHAGNHPPLDRPITAGEFSQALEEATSYGLSMLKPH